MAPCGTPPRLLALVVAWVAAVALLSLPVVRAGINRDTVIDSSQLAVLRSLATEWGRGFNYSGAWSSKQPPKRCVAYPGIICNDKGIIVGLNVSNTNINGTIKGLNALTALALLDMSQNPIKDVTPLGPLTNLVYLNLQALDIEKAPNALGNLGLLKHLNLNQNYLSTPLPPFVTALTALTHLDLGFNDLSGSLPPGFGNLKNLKKLVLSHGGDALGGKLPPSFSSLTKLRELYMNDNAFGGSIPAYIGSFVSLSYLRLSNNMFSGSIPKDLSRLKSLQFLGLRYNWLTGSIPAALASLSKLTYLAAEDKRMLSPERAAEDKHMLSLERAAEDKHMLSPERAAEDKHMLSLERAAEDKHMLSLERAAEDKHMLSPERAAEDKHMLSPERAAEDKRMLSLERAAEDKRMLSPERAAEDKRMLSPERAAEDKHMLSPERAAEDKHMLSLERAAEDKPMLSLERAAEDKHMLSLERAAEDKHMLSPERAAEDINLESNYLSGTLPNIDRLKLLTDINVRSNYLSGTIPPRYLLLPYHSLASNYFVGEVSYKAKNGTSLCPGESDVESNCLRLKWWDKKTCGNKPPQRSAEACWTFCRAASKLGTCGRRGVCVPASLRKNDSAVVYAACRCQKGAAATADNQYCVKVTKNLVRKACPPNPKCPPNSICQPNFLSPLGYRCACTKGYLPVAENYWTVTKCVAIEV
ncbi:unnamed protein product [Closterium sp. Yama58-4]|nr:unnamed protein product [Closterium sp. Yama58-4]